MINKFCHKDGPCTDYRVKISTHVILCSLVFYNGYSMQDLDEELKQAFRAPVDDTQVCFTFTLFSILLSQVFVSGDDSFIGLSLTDSCLSGSVLQDLFSDSQTSESKDELPNESPNRLHDVAAPSVLAMNLKLDSAPPDDM